MSEFEDRLRAGLGAEVREIDADRLLADVTRTVVRRRRRRAAVAVAAAVALIAGSIGIAVALGGDDPQRTLPSDWTPIPTPSPTPSPTPLPAGATQGVVDAASTDAGIYRLTVNVGCVACSTVWLREDGGWERLHDFGADAWAGTPDVSHGPVSKLVMSDDGRNGWAYGPRLFATHDGGETWTLVTGGPGEVADDGHEVALTDQYAWSLLRGSRGLELWRASLYSEEWERVDPPQGADLGSMTTIGRHVAIGNFDEVTGGPPPVRYSPDGVLWGRVDYPCDDVLGLRAATSVAYLVCREGPAEKLYMLTGPEHETLDLRQWDPVGTVPAGTDGFRPLGDDRVLVLGRQQAWLMVLGETRPVDLGLGKDEVAFPVSREGPTSLLTTSSNRLLASTDGGRTWGELR